MSVTLKLSDEDADIVARTLKAVYTGITVSKAFGFEALKAEVKAATGGEIDPNSNTSQLLDNRRKAIIGEAIDQLRRQWGVKEEEILRQAYAFETAVRANAR